MKSFMLFFIFLLFATFDGVTSNEICTSADIKNVSLCLEKYVPHGFSLLPKYGSILERSNLINDWEGVCSNKKDLNKCLGDAVIQRCFNIKNMSTVPYLGTTDAAKVYIADFLKTDYVCQKVFNFTDNDATCYVEKLPKSIAKICKRDFSSCDGINELSNCIKKLAYKKCRKYVACFVQKTATLEKCSYSGCGGCDGISANNSLIENLCNDDRNSTVIDL